ncbi:MAG: Eco57I restriction-modification methylase domain-containing protein, partial [Gemmatimonadales bacterium]
MSLARVLAAVRALHDLPHLVAALGFEPFWEEVPPEAWLAGTRRAATVDGAAAVGRAGGFLWFGVETAEPGPTARAIATVLLQRGETAGVIALNRAERRLALAVAFGDPAALEIDLTSPTRLALTCLARVRGSADGEALAIAARAAEALSGEAVGRRFFETFRDTIDRMSTGLDSPAGVDDRRNLVLLQLTRVLFLYFVQAKGWLNGDQEFLRHQIDDCLAARRQIHRDLLRPLFFGTLNRPAAQRGRSAGFGQVPYLNGGLFEPHALERRWRGDIPNRLWRPAFDDLFERFHFTVSESGSEGSVAPDMLGQVFEGVMAPDLRRASGTFYTPAALVRDLLEAGLAALVASRLKCSDEEASARIRSGEPQTQEILRTLTLLDPAAGSGAFLVGALEHLATLRSGDGPMAGELKREILRNNLFGVDLNPMAVRLTELRLWLAVIADDPEPRAERVVPLPNLDCLVRQGDSLFDPVSFTSQLPLRATGAARLLTGLRRRLVVAVGAEKREMARALRRTETQAMREWLDQAEERLGLETAECLIEARAPTLFGDRRGLDRSLRERLTRLRQRTRTIRRARRRLDQAGELPWFQYQSHFADVFAARGGFDLVVGNPPWVRAEHLEPVLRERLEQRYRWWRSGGGPGFSHRPDLAVAFLERAHELTAPDGVTALLLPAKLATAGYGAAARRALSATATLHAVANLTGAPGAQFGATVYPLALVASKTPAATPRLVRDTLAPEAAPTVPQVTLRGGAPWAMVRSDLRAALEAVHAAHPRLGDRFAVQL